MKILCVSDVVDKRLYHSAIKDNYQGVELLVSCGDLPHDYLDFLSSMLGVPLFYVLGNHDHGVKDKIGGTSLNETIIRHKQVTFAGFSGSYLYNDTSSPLQLTDGQMKMKACKLAPKLLYNYLRHGSFVDVIVSHAPPMGIHDSDDETDRCHKGFKAYLNLIKRYRPKYFLHGHSHIYDQREEWQTMVGKTTVMNVYPFRVIEV